jgi:DNA-binding FadR family transcriptional regulator
VEATKAETRITDNPAEAGTIHHAIARQIGTAILSGKLKPLDTVGGENSQSRIFGVSRPAYREAIRILLAKGLVETRAKSGTLVAPKRNWNLLDPEIIEWMFAGTPDLRFIQDLLELRALVEPAAAALAAERRSDSELEELRAAIDTMARHGLQSESGQDADRHFHNVMLAASRNEAFASLSRSIEAAVKWLTLYRQRLDLWQSELVDEHRAVFDGIEAGNPDKARQAMDALLHITLVNVTSEFHHDV